MLERWPVLMTRAYSLDIRDRVVLAVLSGETCRSVAMNLVFQFPGSWNGHSASAILAVLLLCLWEASGLTFWSLKGTGCLGACLRKRTWPCMRFWLNWPSTVLSQFLVTRYGDFWSVRVATSKKTVFATWSIWPPLAQLFTSTAAMLKGKMHTLKLPGWLCNKLCA